MRPTTRPRWNLSPKAAVALQRELRPRVRLENDFDELRTVAGADISLDADRGVGYAGVIVFRLDDLEEIERVSATGPLRFPYVPGLLSFREGPLLLRAFAKLRAEPDLLMFDGQGYAHPRRLGIASHLSLLLDRPGIGVGKSRLVGAHREPGRRRGCATRLRDHGETIGAVVRTRDGVKPVYVSVGHRVDLDTAVRLALRCSDGYRVPKPTRLADQYVGELRRSGKKRSG